MSQADDVRGGGGRRGNQARPVDPNRVPTADEIAQVTALGFSEFMATHAIRMAEYNCTVAVEILLTNEPGIMAFIEQQNAAKIE